MDSSAHSTLLAAGLMSGTSIDGIDAALIRVEGTGPASRLEYIGFACLDFPQAVREGLLELASGAAVAPAEISRMSFRLGELYGAAVVELAADSRIPLDTIDCIGCHGQTIYHQGRPMDYAGTPVNCTMQIGEPAVVAALTGAAVVSNFRAADIAAGGQGAPLVPYFDYVFLRSETASRAIQNIGGIANVTWLAAGCGMDEVIAFDNGPGNMLIDAAADRFTSGRLRCDVDGRMALAGQPSADLLDRLLQHPHYAQKPPKSAGREQFGVHYLDEIMSFPEAQRLSPQDLLATLTELTAHAIADSYRRHLPLRVDEMIVSGGGANNPALMGALGRAAGMRVRRFDNFGIPGDAKEAAAFALLAAETLRGVPSNVPSATGASRAVVLGSVTPAPAGASHKAP